jgi:hypothetical protein
MTPFLGDYNDREALSILSTLTANKEGKHRSTAKTRDDRMVPRNQSINLWAALRVCEISCLDRFSSDYAETGRQGGIMAV